jgi:hypothetical protein
MVLEKRTRGKNRMNEEKKGLREELDFIKDQLSESGIINEKKIKNKDNPNRERKFKLQLFSSTWFKARMGRRHVKRKWVIIFHLKNRSLQLYKKQIINQTVMIDGIPRIATEDNILLWNGRRPTLIIRDNSVKPVSPSDFEFFDISEDSVQQGKKGLNIKGYQILMDRMKNEAIKTKKPIPGWLWIVGGLVIAGAIGYMLWSK